MIYICKLHWNRLRAGCRGTEGPEQYADTTKEVAAECLNTGIVTGGGFSKYYAGNFYYDLHM